MRGGGVEPPPQKGLDPKSSASANSAILAKTNSTGVDPYDYIPIIIFVKISRKDYSDLTKITVMKGMRYVMN